MRYAVWRLADADVTSTDSVRAVLVRFVMRSMIPDVDGWYVASVRVAGLVAMRLRGPPGVRGEGVEQRAMREAV